MQLEPNIGDTSSHSHTGEKPSNCLVVLERNSFTVRLRALERKFKKPSHDLGENTAQSYSLEEKPSHRLTVWDINPVTVLLSGT